MFEDFSNIKVGDKVTLLNSDGNPCKIMSVDKVNKKSFCAGSMNFKFDGYSKGSNWYPDKCKITTIGDYDFIRTKNKQYKCKSILIFINQNLPESESSLDELLKKLKEIESGIINV